MSDASMNQGVNNSTLVDDLKEQIRILEEKLAKFNNIGANNNGLSSPFKVLSNPNKISVKPDEDQKSLSSLSADQINKRIAIQKIIGSIHLNINESGIQLLNAVVQSPLF